MTKTPTLSELDKNLNDLGITLEVSAPFFNPESKMFDYNIILRRGDKRMVTEFHTGAGHIEIDKEESILPRFKKVSGYYLDTYPKDGSWHDGGGKALNLKGVVFARNSSTWFFNLKWRAELPKLADVLSCLILDSSATDESFADWCGNYGYDDDSIKARETYELCVA